MKKMYEIVGYVSLFILVLIFLVSYNNNTITNIQKYSEYALGTIEYYSPPSKKRSSSTIRISFFDKNDSLINTSATFGRVPADEAKVGKQYVIVYNYKKPTDCILLSQYPVNDSTDFIKYKEDFIYNPPNLDKYKRSFFRRKSVK